MKAINSRSTSGTDAVKSAVYFWWFHKVDAFSRVEEWAELVGTSGFPKLHNHEVGRALVDAGGCWEWFLKDLRADPTALAIGSQADIETDREEFRAQLGTELGAALKKSQWWKDHIDEIETERKKVKTVKGVMEA